MVLNRIITATILTINGGSSSIRFALYETEKLSRLIAGKVDRIGLPGTTLEATGEDKEPTASLVVNASSHREVAGVLISWLEKQIRVADIEAVGHRVVHGMSRSEPAIVTTELLGELHQITPFDPDHLPSEIGLIEAFRERHPKLQQVACFDTAFHRAMPRVAKLLPLPRRLSKAGLQRYGFHGLSYAYLMEELARLGDPAAKDGAVVLAHLGNGASMAAVRDGKSVDTSMCFTPASGLIMSSRSGDLDPGIAYYLSKAEGTTPARFQKMVNHESGLLGVSETSSDMRDLLSVEEEDQRAAEAIELFCYTAKKQIGSYAAALGGLDSLVFAGGIGENSHAVRTRTCRGLDFLGVELDEARNAVNAPVISCDAGPVRVRVIPTDEELMIARSVARLLGLGAEKESKG